MVDAFFLPYSKDCLIGVPLAGMNIRTIGIVGYAGVSIAVFLLLGILFRRHRREVPA